jgi:membrane protein YdbS with pleckstrin-like domain
VLGGDWNQQGVLRRRPPSQELNVVIVLIILLVLAVGSGPYTPYSRGWGWYPSGGLWIVLVLLLILYLLGVVH